MCLTVITAGCESQWQEAETETVSASSQEHAVVNTVTLTAGKYSAEKLDDSWDKEESVWIKLDGDSISAEGRGVSVDGTTAKIKREGTYVLEGKLENGQIIVDVPDSGGEKAEVKLVLNNAEITSSSIAPIYIKSGKTVITLAEDTENIVSDGVEYVLENEDGDEPDAAIFAKDDLTFNGTGKLQVTGNHNHAIQSKNDLKFVTGTYDILSAGDGIVGKDSVSVKNGYFTIEAGGDGIKATNTEETDKGYVMIDKGVFVIHSVNDGIQAETLLRINDGDFEITAGSGSGSDMQEAAPEGVEPPQDAGAPEGMEPPQNGEMPEGMEPPQNGEAPEGMEPPQNGETPEDGRDRFMERRDEMRDEMPQRSRPAEWGKVESSDEPSAKGLKSYVDLVVAGGEFQIDTRDDAINGRQNVMVEDGTLTIRTGDDGIHSDQTLIIDGGTIDIQKSYEGIEGFDITINDGDIRVVSSDDGVNAAGEDESPETEEDVEEPYQDENLGRNEWQNPMAEEDQGAVLRIKGGILDVNAQGDGIDANGDVFMSGGEVTVHGPENNANGALDFASKFQITGGTFIGAGSSGMAQNPTEDSQQPVIVQSLPEAAEAGTVITVKDGDGEIIVYFRTEKKMQWYAISAPELVKGKTYTVRVGEEETEVTLRKMVTEVITEEQKEAEEEKKEEKKEEEKGEEKKEEEKKEDDKKEGDGKEGEPQQEEPEIPEQV